MGNTYTKIKNSIIPSKSKNGRNSHNGLRGANARYVEFGFANNNLSESLLTDDNIETILMNKVDELSRKINRLETEISRHNNQMICVKNDLTALLDNDQILMKNINDIKNSSGQIINAGSLNSTPILPQSYTINGYENKSAPINNSLYQSGVADDNYSPFNN